jgi:hypothetical protein
MKTYLITFLTNYEEAGLIITTDKGLKYAKSRAEYLGAWDDYSIKEINTTEEGVYYSVNFGSDYFGKLNDNGECS